MELAEVPRKILAYIACAVSGFAFAMWCAPIFSNKSQISNPQNGFSLRLPVAQLRNLNEAMNLRGKKVKLLKRNLSLTPKFATSDGARDESKDDEKWCLIEHPALLFNIREQSVILFAELTLLDVIPLQISRADLNAFKVVGVDNANHLESCRDYARVVYGS